MSDPLETAFDEFANATEQTLSRMSEQLRSFREEMESLRTEQRSAPVASAPLLPSPVEVREGPAGRDGKDGADGRDGKDAVVNTEEIIARLAELAVPRIVSLIPTPANGKDGRDGEPGERGEDGLSSLPEILAAVREATALHFRGFYQGVYRADTDYTVGQAATWDGSMWVATRGTQSKPGTDDSWVLAVKRGRDAKR